MSEFVVAVCEIIIEFVAVEDFEDVEEEDVDYHVREDHDYREDQVIVEVIFSYLVSLGDLSFIGEHFDEEEKDGSEEERLSMGCICMHTIQKGFHAFVLVYYPELLGVFVSCLVLCQVYHL